MKTRNVNQKFSLVPLGIMMALIFAGIISCIGQNIEISFAGDNNGQPVSLDSIIIKNVTQGGEVTLYSPDLTLVLIITGIENRKIKKSKTFALNQNYPNPCKGQTSIQLQMPESAKVEILVSNLLGQSLLNFNKTLSRGGHTFSFIPGKEPCYFLTVNCLAQTKTIKMICKPDKAPSTIDLTHTGYATPDPAFKNTELLGELPYEPGDELLMIAYSASGESGMVKSPEVSQEYIIQFATNVVCPGLDSLLYEGQWYHAIQIGGQCWLKENLNVGEMISGSQSQTNNGTIEKYCYANSVTKCDEYGGLYIWDETMQYTTEKRAQGVCPEGWHIPTDEEFKVLEGMVDSEYPLGHPVWNNDGLRGTDAGKNLKSTSGWYNNGNGIDIYGCRVLASGYWYGGGFDDFSVGTTFYSSTVNNSGQPYYRGFVAMTDQVLRNLSEWTFGSPVRCIKD